VSLDRASQENGPVSSNPSETGKEAPNPSLNPSPSPAIPPAPANCFPREEIVSEILDLTDQVASTALFGSIGVGKSFVALALLHHDRTKVKFDENRHFMRCNDLTNLEGFLERLSGAIGASRTMDIGQFRSHFESSPPHILLLDGVDHITDPIGPEAEEILSAIEELGCYQHVCLLTTCRMYPEIRGFHRVEVPILSGGDARDGFYGLCHLDRSPVIDNLIERLDFHPLSIDLLASSIRENNWDESALLEKWGSGRAGPSEVRYRQSLRDGVESSFRLQTIQNLGTTAREVLDAIAASPCDIEEGRLDSILPGTTGVGVAIDVLCKFSLLYRKDGFVKMLSPFRFYFLDLTLEPTQHVEIIRWDPANCSASKACAFLSLPLYYTCGITVFEGPPVFTRGPGPLPATRPSKAPPKESWIEKFRSMQRSEHNGLILYRRAN